MKKLHFAFLVAIILQLPSISYCQYSRQQAQDLVLNQILASDTGHINVYSSYHSFQDTSHIILQNNQMLSNPFHDSWAFFSDDHPLANWEHPCRYIFVDASLGTFSLDSITYYPTDIANNYQPVSITLSYNCPPDCNTGLTNSLPDNPPVVATPNPHLWAVLINGIDDYPNSCDINRDYDIALMYNALKEAGYIKQPGNDPTHPDNHILVLYDNGDPILAGKTVFHNDWDGTGCWVDNSCSTNVNCTLCDGYQNQVYKAGYKSNIIETFEDFYQTQNAKHPLSPEDQLFVYITGIGGVQSSGQYAGESYFQCYTPNGTPYGTSNQISSTELREAVRSINCAQIIFVMQQSSAGGFISNTSNLLNDVSALCNNRLVLTATGSGTSAYSNRELWLTCANTDEFTFYFTAALRGNYESRFPWRWSYPVGTFPFSNNQYSPNWQLGCYTSNIHNHPLDYHPDSGTPDPLYGTVTSGNNDGFTQFIEAFNYANWMDTYTTYGYINQDKLNPYFPITCNDIETPMMGIKDGFGEYSFNNGTTTDALYCLNGIAGSTSTGTGLHTVTGGRGYLLGGNLNVHSDITIEANAEITIGVDNAILDIDNNSKFTASKGLILTGTTCINNPDVLLIENHDNILVLEDVYFTSIYLQNFGDLTIKKSTTPPFFDNCPYIASARGNVNIQNSNFINNSPLYLGNGDRSDVNSAIVKNCSFTFSTNSTAFDVMVESYHKYSIQGNHITHGSYGLGLNWCGSASYNNKVTDNYITSITNTGLRIYDSQGILEANHIYNNNRGIELLNSSNVSMVGYQNAQNNSSTQEIHDCSDYELYATDDCFPSYMKYNVITDGTTNNQYPLFYYDNKQGGAIYKYDVKYNCWGDNFDPGRDLKLNWGVFLPYPVWCPPHDGTLPDPDEDMYNMAVSNFDSANYTEAMNLFQLLVVTYPKSDYAKASMKAMFETESHAGNNFSDLKLFYLTNDSILADTSLTRLGEFLANKCDVQMQNYPDAIYWYENRIQNSTDPNDSVFAIIDLGNLYLMMDTTGNRPTFMGSMPQYKPTSKTRYMVYRDSLLSLLPFSKNPFKKNITRLQNGRLLQNVPNPSNTSTDFYINLSGATNANIKIYNNLGQLNQVIPITNFTDGTQKITINTSNLSAGIYGCTLMINGKTTDIKKMVVIR
jgi:hypothetical protein